MNIFLRGYVRRPPRAAVKPGAGGPGGLACAGGAAAAARRGRHVSGWTGCRRLALRPPAALPPGLARAGWSDRIVRHYPSLFDGKADLVWEQARQCPLGISRHPDLPIAVSGNGQEQDRIQSVSPPKNRPRPDLIKNQRLPTPPASASGHAGPSHQDGLANHPADDAVACTAAARPSKLGHKAGRTAPNRKGRDKTAGHGAPRRRRPSCASCPAHTSYAGRPCESNAAKGFGSGLPTYGPVPESKVHA